MRTRIGIDPGLQSLLEKAPSVELDYGFVMEGLKEYQNPRVKLHHLLKIGALIRVKKGIYIFGPTFAKQPYCVEVLANMIYGPSYVSLEWACQFYGLIPEKVTTVTSVTTKRSKEFTTPIGLFSYDHLSEEAFSPGTTLVRFSEKQQGLVATKEKALIDLLCVRRGYFQSSKHFKETLFEDLRVERDDLKKLDLTAVLKLYEAHPHSATKYLLQTMESL